MIGMENSRKKFNKLTYFVVLFFSLIIGYRPFEFGSDYQNYINYYYGMDILEPGYLVLNKIYLFFGFPAEFFIFSLALLSGVLFVTGLNRYKLDFEYKLLSHLIFWILLMSAHFRSGIALSIFIYLGESIVSAILCSSLFHFSFVGAFIPFLFFKLINHYKLIYILLILLIVFVIRNILYDFSLEVASFIFDYLGRERNLLALSGAIDNVHENRNLWYFENVKIYICIYYIFIALFFIENNLLSLFVFIPCFSYIAYGYDAYMSEKIFLSTYPLLAIGISGMKSGFLKRVTIFFMFCLVGKDLLARFEIIELRDE